MSTKKNLSKEPVNTESFEIPSDVSTKVTHSHVYFTRGEKALSFISYNPSFCAVKFENNNITVDNLVETKKSYAIYVTTLSNIKNCIRGFTEDFVYKLQIQYKHFPIRVLIKENTFIIENFVGEKHPRTVKFRPEEVKISIKKDIIECTGTDIKKVSQCAANIEKATIIRGKDRRVFRDGIYMIK